MLASPRYNQSINQSIRHAGWCIIDLLVNYEGTGAQEQVCFKALGLPVLRLIYKVHGITRPTDHLPRLVAGDSSAIEDFTDHSRVERILILLEAAAFVL